MPGRPRYWMPNRARDSSRQYFNDSVKARKPVCSCCRDLPRIRFSILLRPFAVRYSLRTIASSPVLVIATDRSTDSAAATDKGRMPAEIRREQVCALLAVGAFRLPARRPLIAAAEPSPDMNGERNCSQYEHKMYQRHHRYFGRMVLYPFPPSQQSRSRKSDEEFPCRPQPSPEALVRSTSGVPK